MSDELESELVRLFSALSNGQKQLVIQLAGALAVSDLEVDVGTGSDIATPEFGELFGDVLISHYVGSSQSFTKDKFEYGMEGVLQLLGRDAELAPPGNPGNDIGVDGERWSLKTEAAKNIKEDRIHISKFMELGRGAWETEADLEGLRQQMVDHMEGYERILTLRCLSAARNAPEDYVSYELVEIPKELLLESLEFPCQMHGDSSQTPKPGSCLVTDPDGEVRFELYFDGGTERKLQVRKLDKSLCQVHATWKFIKPSL